VVHDDKELCSSATHDTSTPPPLHGFPITTPERTLADLWPRLDAKEQAKTLRNALRLKRLTIPSLAAHLSTATSRQRPRTLTSQLDRYAKLKLHRCRSDAEALAVVTLHDAKIATPDINVRIAGEEADLSWPDQRRILEIDGGSFHQDKLEDARKTAAWRAAGWRVERIAASQVYDDPNQLIRAARPGS
jgi:very-short-patch-repair endonuclease